MSEYTYTAQDFAAAQFAIDPNEEESLRQYWMRRDLGATPWDNALGELRSDELMSRSGCIPVYAEPYSPEALQRAWEHGEEPRAGERATEGMVTVFRRTTGGNFTLLVNDGGEHIDSRYRIVYRPPVQERDPVADLVQAMEDALPEEAGSPVALRRYAEALAEYGVRVMTDDE